MIPKILAMYLPQYHAIPENDEFWGKGFTDWLSVRKASPLYDGHRQPRIPLNNNYYDLSLKENIAWQAQLAHKYGIHGFGIYHYWFNNDKNLLTRPVEIISDNKDIDINYFLAWDNISWRRTWSNVKGNDWAPAYDKQKAHKGNGILIEYIPGGEADWKKHFDYLAGFFHDERYVKIDGKPVFVIFHYSSIVSKMCEYWNQLALANGFNGIYIIYRRAVNKNIPKEENTFFYEPSASAWDRLPTKIYRRLMRQLHLTTGLHCYDYDRVWQRLLRKLERHGEKNLWPCAFVDYDDTPRRGRGGTVFKHADANKFAANLSKLLSIAKRQEKPYVLLVAWNEWSEGAYLEPDTHNGHQYLEAVRRAVESTEQETE